MFTRRDAQPNRPATETRAEPEATTPLARPAEPSTPTPGAPSEPPAARNVAAPQQSVPTRTSGAQDVSIVAAGDVFDGKLTTTSGVRVLGTVRGTIESRSNIQIDADALVEADITAENVTIAGTYKGNLDCNGRLEVTSSGRASGDLNTGRILLHEGGFFEGSLHMKPEQPAAPGATEAPRRRYGSS